MNSYWSIDQLQYNICTLKDTLWSLSGKCWFYSLLMMREFYTLTLSWVKIYLVCTPLAFVTNRTDQEKRHLLDVGFKGKELLIDLTNYMKVKRYLSKRGKVYWSQTKSWEKLKPQSQTQTRKFKSELHCPLLIRFWNKQWIRIPFVCLCCFCLSVCLFVCICVIVIHILSRELNSNLDSFRNQRFDSVFVFLFFFQIGNPPNFELGFLERWLYTLWLFADSGGVAGTVTTFCAQWPVAPCLKMRPASPPYKPHRGMAMKANMKNRPRKQNKPREGCRKKTVFLMVFCQTGGGVGGQRG